MAEAKIVLSPDSSQGPVNRKAQYDSMCLKMRSVSRNALGLTCAEIQSKLFELVLIGHEITHIKEYWPIGIADFFSLGITAGKTTYCTYWVGDQMVDDLKSYGSSKRFGKPNITWYKNGTSSRTAK